MQDRGARGTTEWERYEVELPVAAEATRIVFGGVFPANGTGWFDSLKVELDGTPPEADDRNAQSGRQRDLRNVSARSVISVKRLHRYGRRV